jgi:hypothetical protein
MISIIAEIESHDNRSLGKEPRAYDCACEKSTRYRSEEPAISRHVANREQLSKAKPNKSAFTIRISAVASSNELRKNEKTFPF